MGTITITASGKDGVGKSTLSVFIGASLASISGKVLVIELDSGQRSIDIVSGTYGKLIYDINDVLSGKIEPAKAIVESPVAKDLFVLSAPFIQSSLSIDEFFKLVSSLGEEYNHVIIDTASSMGAMFAACSCAMNALLVTTADPAGIREANSARDRLIENSVFDIRLIINRLVPSRITSGVFPDLDFVIDSIGSRLIGVVPESEDIASASSGILALPRNSKSKEIFDNIAKRMLGVEIPLSIQ
jgi:septum site-determining protein MinD